MAQFDYTVEPRYLEKKLKGNAFSESGKGKNRKKLNEVVNLTIAFFKKRT